MKHYHKTQKKISPFLWTYFILIVEVYLNTTRFPFETGHSKQNIWIMDKTSLPILGTYERSNKLWKYTIIKKKSTMSWENWGIESPKDLTHSQMEI